MAKTVWKVHSHGPIQKLADNLWWVQGSLPGMSLKRVMVVAKMADRRLVIHSGIALEERAMKELEAWGTPAFIVVPNRYHRMDAPAYKQRYPATQVVAPRGARKRVEEVVPVDLTYEEFPRDDAVQFETLDGVRDEEGAMLVTSSDGVSVVLNDVVMNMDRKKDLPGYLLTTIMGSAPGPRVSRLSKLVLVKHKPALRAHLERLAAQPGLIRLIVAHEKIASGPDAAEALRRAASDL